MNLSNLRKKINVVDSKIISLLAKRQSLVISVGKFKKENNLPIYQPNREKEVLSKLEKLATLNKIDRNFVRNIFKVIFKNSRSIQRKL